MRVSRRQFVSGAGVAMATLLTACGAQGTQDQTAAEAGGAANREAATTSAPTSSLSLDSAAWSYDADNDVYYQLGISYCESPADASYEQLAILVPGAYFMATDNGDGTFTCEVNASGAVGDFTAATAPIVIPVNTPGYSAQSPMSEYSAQSAGPKGKISVKTVMDCLLIHGLELIQQFFCHGWTPEPRLILF